MADGEEDKKIIIAGEEETKRIVLVGAGDESEEKKVGEGGGNRKRNWNGDQLVPPPPPGFRFTPREDELVRYYLLPKLQGREHVPNDAIIEDNVYQCHPDQLTEKYRDRGDESWHFLSPRARKYRNGDRPSRSTDDSRGRWKASTGTKVVVISVDGGDGDGDGSGIKTTKSKAMMQQGAGDGKIRYSESTLSYYEGPIRNEVKSRWLMKELTIPEYEKKRGKNGGGGDPNMLNQYVMCKIYVTPRRRGDGDGDEEEDEAGPSWTQPEPEEDSGQGCEKLSEKQAGKRPAKDQSAGGPPKRAHRLNPDRLHLGPPPSLLGHGMHAPVMAPGYYGGGPGRPMGYYARPPVPRPPMMMYNNNGQAPVAYNGQVNMPRQQAAYNGGQVVPRQQAAYNGQVPVPRQQVPYNGQVPVPRQQVPYNGQVMRPPVLKLSPPYRPAGAPTSAGQNQTMMKRPPCPAGAPSSAGQNQSMMKRPPCPAGAPSSAGQNQTMTKLPPCPAGAPSSAGQNQTMMKRPPCPAGAPSPDGQNQTMMKRPPCPAGQAVKNPPSSAVPRPAQTQKQPETEEMRENRVLRQHMEEYSRIMQSSTPRPPVSAAHVAQQQQQQRRPVTAFTQQQQYQQQQQRPMMASTHQQQQYQQQQQQQQRLMMASTHQQQYQQQQRPMMASMHHHQQRPYFGGNANYHHHAGGMVPQYSLESFYASEAAQDYQHSRVIPAASAPAGPSTASAEGLVSSVVSGAGNEVSGANRDCSNGDEMEFVESASAGGTTSAADGDGPKI